MCVPGTVTVPVTHIGCQGLRVYMPLCVAVALQVRELQTGRMYTYTRAMVGPTCVPP